MAQELDVQPFRWRHRNAALRFLRLDGRQNLFLLDLVDPGARFSAASEPPADVIVACRGEEVVGVASRRPSLCFAAGTDAQAFDALLPHCEHVTSGLAKSDVRRVGILWDRLAARGHTAIVDRTETAHWLDLERVPRFAPPPGVKIRPALKADLGSLVFAARAGLREESRPDPYSGDPEGFQRWVSGRIRNALVVEADGRVAFVGYSDVRRPEGCLVQGVYTWAGFRRRGLAAAGVSALCARAFDEGSNHVQLAVVDGNRAGETLYSHLGFRPFARLRTILFS